MKPQLTRSVSQEARNAASGFQILSLRMKSITPHRLFALVAAALAFPAMAHAHSGSALAYDCASGFAHPLFGWDHFAAMVAVGVWAAQLGGRARWLAPGAFVTVMACGAFVGARGAVFPGVEPVIATSVLTLGVLVAAGVRMPLTASLLLVSFFAIAHGFAHGAEMPAGASTLSYGTGFITATLGLHIVGLCLGQLALRRSRHLPRILGAVCTAAGAVLLVA
jgi:urease accessory protein